MSTLYPTTELASAHISAIADTNALKSDPSAYIFGEYSIESDIDVTVVENNAGTVNLALPYYSSVDAAASSAMSDEDIAEVSGGEYMSSYTTYVADTTDSDGTRFGDRYWNYHRNNGFSGGGGFGE